MSKRDEINALVYRCLMKGADPEDIEAEVTQAYGPLSRRKLKNALAVADRMIRSPLRTDD